MEAMGINRIICLIKVHAAAFLAFPNDWMTILVVISKELIKLIIKKVRNNIIENSIYKGLSPLPNREISGAGNSK